MGIFQPAMLYDQRVHKWGYKVIYNPYGLFDPNYPFVSGHLYIGDITYKSILKKRWSDGPTL